jgi:hypothetical protein
VSVPGLSDPMVCPVDSHLELAKRIKKE